MNDLAISAISLFSGVGMLDEGFRAGLEYMGIGHRTVCHVEREAHAAAVLVARMEEGSLDAAPVWSDVTTFDAKAWRGKVDCIVAGFPCQDLSVAGRRVGLDGSRSGLFFEVVRIAEDSGAAGMFLENVAGIASATASVVDEAEGELDERAAARVVGELADCGWHSEWITLSASDVGASHGRARWFCLAWRNMAYTSSKRRQQDAGSPYGNEGPHEGRTQEHNNQLASKSPNQLDDAARHVGHGDGEREGGSGRGVCEAGDPVGDAGLQHRDVQQWKVRAEHPSTDIGMADAERAERRPHACAGICGEQGRDAGRQAAGRTGDGCEVLADASGTGFQKRIGGGKDNGSLQQTERTFIRSVHSAFGLFAPGPSDPRWGSIISQFPELAPALEPAFRSVVNGLAFDMGDSRAARLKCVGNGVVPLDAATAFVVLARRAGLG